MSGSRVLLAAMTSRRELPMSDSASEQAVRATYAAYLAAFQQDDAADAILPYFQTPCLLLAPQGDRVIGSIDELRLIFAAMKARLQGLDYGHSETTDISVKLLSDDLAAISLCALRYDRAGHELERLGCFYLMRRSGGQWRFVQLAMYDADRLLRLA